MADTQTKVQGQAQNQNQGTVVAQEETAVQSGIFGGSAEAVDAMVNPKPVVDQNSNAGDSGETFNFDEIDFGKQEVAKTEEIKEEIAIPEVNVKEETVVKEEAVIPEAVKPLSPEGDLPLTREREEDEKIIEEVAEEKIEDIVVKEEVEAEPESSLQNLFDTIYEKVEHLYELQEVAEGNILLISDTNYSFVLKSFSVDTIDIHKADVNISFSLDSGSLDVFVNTKHLFSEDDLLEHEDKMAEVRQKLEFFLDLVSKEENAVEAEAASKKAEEEKSQMFDHFKQF